MTSFDDFDEQNSPRPDQSDFGRILDRAVNRRSFLKTGAAFGVSSFVTGGALAPQIAAADDSKLINFEAVAANIDDTITVPAGYQWHTVASWGDPLFADSVPFDQKTRGSGFSQERSIGDNTDGMKLFHLAQDEGILVTNNEYVNKSIIHPDGVNTADDVRKSKAGHGVSVFHIKRKNGKWSPVIGAKHNRRITADTLMAITGPARGHPLMQTSEDPEGVRSKGTWNNCGNGATPWGTYLACEENFNGYYASTDESTEPTAEQKRYGVGIKDWGYGWYKFDPRFDISKEPNESNRNGYVVEIDPMVPHSSPKKRTALGRFKHENAELVIADNGKVVVYMGDDERGEFLYRFISEGIYNPEDQSQNRELLSEGTLYVARFGEADENLSGDGKWIELSVGKNGLNEDNGFPTQAEICIHSRVAASLVGATTMDRPEWVASHPSRAEVYCCLTNNKNRGLKPNSGGDDTPVGGPNPREANLYGQIVRWRPFEGDHTADSFEW
ncbi:MAG: PhoX family protein, partial [Granulosicoccaceae bacterium]